jgi:hypothetical protein
MEATVCYGYHRLHNIYLRRTVYNSQHMVSWRESIYLRSSKLPGFESLRTMHQSLSWDPLAPLPMFHIVSALYVVQCWAVIFLLLLGFFSLRVSPWDRITGSVSCPLEMSRRLAAGGFGKRRFLRLVIHARTPHSPERHAHARPLPLPSRVVASSSDTGRPYLPLRHGACSLLPVEKEREMRAFPVGVCPGLTRFRQNPQISSIRGLLLLQRESSVGIRPRINHMKLYGHTRRQNLSPRAHVAPILFLLYFSFFSVLQLTQSDVHIYA